MSTMLSKLCVYKVWACILLSLYIEKCEYRELRVGRIVWTEVGIVAIIRSVG